MIPFDPDTEVKHGLRQVGKKFVFSINGVNPEDAGLYQVEVDGIKIFSTDLKRKIMQISTNIIINNKIVYYKKYEILELTIRLCFM